MLHMRNGFVLATLVAGALTTRADNIFPTSQARGADVMAQLQTGEGAINDSDTDSAGGFGPYSTNIDAIASIGDPNNPYSASSNATQSSNIGPATISGHGFASAGADPNSPNVTPSGEGTSYMIVDFDINVTQSYTLSGFLDATSIANGLGTASFELIGPGGTEIFSDTNSGLVALAGAGLLAPGSYSLIVVANATADAAGDNATAEFNFEFEFAEVPEPATGALFLLAIFAINRRR